MITIPKQYTSIVYIKPLLWKEVFDTWRELEEWQESWKQHWTERGFDSWDEWRKAYAAPLHLETLNWELYKVTNPLKDFPFIYGTPTKTWIEKAYNGETTKQLKDIVHLPIVTENDKILDIKKDFPKETMLTGIVHDDKIIFIEGMHRACAIATWNNETPFTGNVTIALAQWNNPIPAIGGNYKMK